MHSLTVGQYGAVIYYGVSWAVNVQLFCNPIQSNRCCGMFKENNFMQIIIYLKLQWYNAVATEQTGYTQDMLEIKN